MNLPIRPMAILGLLQTGAIIAGTLGVRVVSKLFASGRSDWRFPICLWFDWWLALMLIPLAWVCVAAWISSNPKAFGTRRAWPFISGILVLLLLVGFGVYSVYKVYKAGLIIF